MQVADRDTLQIDTLSIIPGTFFILNVDARQYHLDATKAFLIWKQRPAVDSIEVQYRVFPFLLGKVQQRLSYDSAVAFTTVRQLAGGQKEGGLFRFGNLQYSGSFTRGIAFGNNQDAVVQSNFNLQLNGMLADSIEIRAAISDNNLPVQADGNTRQLNEFDQVLLQFRKKHWQLNLGDLDLRQNDLYFLNFYKRLQGVSFGTQVPLSTKANAATLVSGSIAKGKFTRNVFQGREGNQGPYRLNGANGELFFMVLANTERVWVDGVQLQRGEDADYIINYNTAEVTFMPRRMITKDSRIQVEFEYADRNYLNANIFVQQKVEVGNKLSIQAALFSNNDARNAPINQPLTEAQKQFLYLAGDSLQQAYFPSALEDTAGRDKVLYEKVYVPGGAALDSFYRYSTDVTLARYALSFSDLGPGRGNYVPDFNGVNGKVFRYVAPVNGIKQGQFEPVILLVPPRKQQVVSVGAQYRPNQHHELSAEAAASQFDPNRFSPKASVQNAGAAAKLNYRNTLFLKGDPAYTLQSTVHVEQVQASFRPLERLRSVEFSRDWGLPLISQPADETVIKAGTGLNINKLHEVNYLFTAYKRGDGYNGHQNYLQQQSNWSGWLMRNSVMLTRFAAGGSSGSYFRPVVDIQKSWPKLGGIQTVFRYDLEQNKVKGTLKDTLGRQSFAFHTTTFSVRSSEQWVNRYSLNFFTRTDLQPDSSKLHPTDRSYNVNLQAELVSNPRHQLVLNTTYRHLEVFRQTASATQNDRTLLGRAEYGVNEWNGLLTGNMLYELGTGQEQRRDFTFIEVPAGQGEYAWIDYNKDDVQQLNEFELAQFRDQARFVRVLVPTNDFIKAAYTTFNYTLNLQPKAAWAKAAIGGIRKHLTRYQLQSALQTSRKTIATNLLQWSPFEKTLADTALISVQTTMGNTLSFNRQSSVWGIDLSSVQNTGKALLSYGLESRRQHDWNLKGRLMIGRNFSFDLLLRQASQSLFTPVFANRNYDIAIQMAEPRIGFISGTVFRLQGSYRLEHRQNGESYGGQRSQAQVFTLDTRYNALQNSSLSGKLVLSRIAFNDEPNTPVAYSMLDGLLPGTNLLWNLELSRRLLNNVEINFSYDGRQPARSKTIHTGRASLRALF